MKLLAIDTSTEVCNVCLWEAGIVAAEYASSSTITHTERLLPALDRLVQKSGWSKQELNGIGVISGPGSFTGLRIGISAVKGLALGLDIPVVAGNALEIAAIQASADGLVCPAMDARRGEVFTALYRYQNGSVKEVLPPVSVRPIDWLAALPDEPISFCGPAIPLYRDLFLQHQNSTILFDQFYLARTLAEWTAARILSGHAIHPSQLRASYLRPSDAEIQGPNPRKLLLKIKDR